MSKYHRRAKQSKMKNIFGHVISAFKIEKILMNVQFLGLHKREDFFRWHIAHQIIFGHRAAANSFYSTVESSAAFIIRCF